MSTTMANLDTTQYVKVNSVRESITLQSFRDEVRITFSNDKPAMGNTVFHTLNGSDDPLQLLNIDTDVWVLAMTDRSGLAITETKAAQVLQTTAFGELEVAQKDPEIQLSAQYNTLALVRSIVASGGSTDASGGMFNAITGTDPAGLAAIFTNRQILSRTGQGAEIIMTGMFSSPEADSRQLVGAATASDGILFGYRNTEFGVFFQHDGQVIIEELTITTPAGGNESTTITIDGTGYTVSITSGTVEHNASEIAISLASQVPLYRFSANGAQVVARAIFAAPSVGAFSFSSPGAAVAAFVQIAEGVVISEEFVEQSAWSEQAILALPLDPQKLNRYKFVFNGSVEYYIEDGVTGKYVLVHKKVHTNIETSPMFSIAAFRPVWACSNQGNTTSLTVSGSEVAAFTQGERHQIKETNAAANGTLSVSSDSTNILTIRCREVFGTNVNLGRVLIAGISAYTDGSKGAIVELCKNMIFEDETNFSYIDKEGSIVEVDTTKSLVSGGKCVATIVIGSTISSQTDNFRDLLLPGETLTLAMRVVSAAAADMSASIVWEEDT